MNTPTKAIFFDCQLYTAASTAAAVTISKCKPDPASKINKGDKASKGRFLTFPVRSNTLNPSHKTIKLAKRVMIFQAQIAFNGPKLAAKLNKLNAKGGYNVTYLACSSGGAHSSRKLTNSG